MKGVSWKCISEAELNLFRNASEEREVFGL